MRKLLAALYSVAKNRRALCSYRYLPTGAMKEMKRLDRHHVKLVRATVRDKPARDKDTSEIAK